VVVAVIDVGMVKAAVNQVIHVVSVRNRLLVRLGAFHGFAIGGIGRTHLQMVLVDVARVGVMQMAIMQIVDMILVPDPRVAARVAVDVRVLVMGLAFHGLAPFRLAPSSGAP
jgi:hypothetical protein